MKNKLLFLTISLLVISSFGLTFSKKPINPEQAAIRQKKDPIAPLKKDGTKHLLVFKKDNGKDLLNPKDIQYAGKVRRQTQLVNNASEWGKKYLERRNYNVVIADNLMNQDFPRGTLILTYKIIKYEPDNRANRAFVGKHAKETLLKVLITVKKDGTLIFSKKYNYFEVRNWAYLIKYPTMEFNREFTYALK
ncbi:hypothetical protein OAR19_00090 [bacterium]|nr:hypothetical protein [bacterium]